MHIHFGMSGAFRTASLPGPEPTPTTRLRLVHEGTGLMAHLSAMTVAHGGLELYQEKVCGVLWGAVGCCGVLWGRVGWGGVGQYAEWGGVGWGGGCTPHSLLWQPCHILLCAYLPSNTTVSSMGKAGWQWLACIVRCVCVCVHKSTTLMHATCVGVGWSVGCVHVHVHVPCPITPQVSKLGPDPLRPDDDKERFWARVQGSKKPIGLLLMDQTAVAGVCCAVAWQVAVVRCQPGSRICLLAAAATVPAGQLP